MRNEHMQRKYKISDIVEFKHFNTLNSFVDYCDGVTAEDRKRCAYFHSETGSQSFCHTENYEHASRLIREGWPEGVKTLEDAMAIAREGMESASLKLAEMSICGPIPIVGAYCAGDPECMMNPAEELEKPAVTIVTDIMTPGVTSTEAIVNRGAAILALAEYLEACGMRTSIYAVASVNAHMVKDHPEVKTKKPVHVTIVKLKDATEEFNMHSLSYAMVNPSMLRRHWFRIIERCQYVKSPGSYGTCMSLSQIEGVENAVGDIDIYFPSLWAEGEDRFLNPGSAHRYVMEKAREVGLAA